MPADEGASAVWSARSLAAGGGRLHGAVVRSIVAESLDFSSAAEAAASLAAPASGGGPPGVSRSGQVIVANEPFVARPLGVAVARAADAALLCIEMGRTRIASAQRTNN